MLVYLMCVNVKKIMSHNFSRKYFESCFIKHFINCFPCECLSSYRYIKNIIKYMTTVTPISTCAPIFQHFQVVLFFQ